VLHPLPLPDQPGTGDRAIAFAQRRLALHPPVLLFDQHVQLGLGPRRKPAVGQLLDPVRQPLDQERLVARRRLTIVELAPELLQLCRGFLWQRRQLRQRTVIHGLSLLRWFRP
jgi:hypothetical protein